jgi:hypothetical protein
MSEKVVSELETALEHVASDLDLASQAVSNLQKRSDDDRKRLEYIASEVDKILNQRGGGSTMDLERLRAVAAHQQEVPL